MVFSVGTPPLRAQRLSGDVNAYRLGTAGSLRQYIQNRWNDVVVEVENKTDKDVVMLATTNIKDHSAQYGRRVWVPAGARRVTSYPMFFGAAPVKDAYPLVSRLLPAEGGSLVKNQESMLHHTSVSASSSKSISAIFLDEFVDMDRDESGDSEEIPEDIAHTMLRGLRVELGQSPRIAHIQEDPLPTSAAGLNTADNLTIAGNRMLEHPATAAAVRNWVLEGGKLWIMLDRVDMPLVRSLVGDSLSCHVIDRLEMNDVQTRSVEDQVDMARRSYTYPVKQLRVLVEGVEVTHTINDWPAAFFLNVGRGRVLFTTLDSRGWLIERENPITNEPVFSSSPELIEIGEQFLRAKQPSGIDPKSLSPYVKQQIGYKIVGRQWIVGILGVFAFVLTGSGLVLMKKGHLERILYIGPAAALVAAGAILGLGFSSKQAVPPTLALEQWVEVEPGAQVVRVDGLLAVYNRAPSNEQIGASDDARFEMELGGLEGETKRVVFTDYNRWRWEDLRLPDGVREAKFVSFLSLERPIEARVKLGPEGLQGKFELGPFKSPTDAILATPSNSNIGLNLDGVSFSATTADALAPGVYVAGNMLSQSQNRRGTMLKSLLGAPDFPRRPTVLVWTAPVRSSFYFPAQDTVVGEALISIPLQLQPSDPGKVTVPGALIPFRSVPGPGRLQANSIYNHRTGEWSQDMRTATVAWFEFQVPEAVLPLKVEEVAVELVANAPGRKIVFTGIQDGKSVDVASANDVTNRTLVPFDDLSLLQPSKRGRIMLGFEMSNGRPGSTWSIQQLQLRLVGTVGERGAAANRD